MANALSLNQKLHYDNMHGTDFGLAHLDNVKNANMNNLMAIDHAARDWLDDTDYLLPRMCAEFPRVSQAYLDKSSKAKPWGAKQEPVYLDPFLDENQLSLSAGPSYERGIWYYTGYPLTDHHDMAGLPSSWRGIQTMLGLEYRPTFWVNIYNRLRYLEFGDAEAPTGTPGVQRMLSKASKIDSELLESLQESEDELERPRQVSGFPDLADLKNVFHNSIE